MISVGLAFDPPVRATRLTYLGSRMSFAVFRGVALEQVRAQYAAQAGRPDGHDDESDEDDPDEYVPDDLKRYRCGDLHPGSRARDRGANQAARQVWKRAWKATGHGELVIVVRHTNRWAADDVRQRYALALMLRSHEQSEPPLYAEMRARFELLAEIEPEIEIT